LISVISSTVSSIVISIAQDWSTTPYLLTSYGGVLGSTRPRWPQARLRISPRAFAPRCLFRDLEYDKAIILFYVDKGELSDAPSVHMALWSKSLGHRPCGFIGGAGDQPTITVLDFFCHWKSQVRRDAATSQSSLGNLNLPAYLGVAKHLRAATIRS